VRQHILGVVGNIMHCFVGNLTRFPAVKELWKYVTILRNYRNNNVAHFWTQCVQCSYTVSKTWCRIFAV